MWSVLRLHGIWPTAGASLITAAAIGATSAEEFLLPAVVIIGTLIFLMAFAGALAPTEAEIRKDAALQAQITEVQRQSRERVTVIAADWPARLDEFFQA